VSALAAIDSWPVGRVAAAVIGPDGVREARGRVDEPYSLASVTKPLSALACLVAVEEGATELDAAAGPAGSTVRHLLAHASGLALDKPKPVAKPGTRRIYSNAGYEVLASHVEAATGMGFADYLRQAVCERLSLQATALRGSAAHGAVSTVANLALVVGELLTPRLLHEQTHADMVRVQFPGLAGVVPGFGRQEHNDWGLGVEIRDDKSPHWTGTRNSRATFGHFGRSGTFLWADPVARIGCVALTDRDFGPWAARTWPELADAVLASYAVP
jgi:CubicO group peptidase (beta-lactamase class C family)